MAVMATRGERARAAPTTKTIAATLAGALAAAVLLVALSVVRSHGSSSTPPQPTPVVSLAGIPQHGRVLGSPDAPVTLIEYADPQCPVCRAYTEKVFPDVVRRYVRTGKVMTEFRGFPFIGEDSVKAYRFLLAAGVQNKLWNLQEAMYRYQGAENSGWVTDDLIRELAAEIPGLDVTRLFADAERSDIRKAAESAESEASGVSGTPSFFVKVGDATPYYIEVGSVDQMRAALDDALHG